MFFRKHLPKLIFLPVLACPPGALAAPAYQVAFAPADFYAYQLNNKGQIVGTSGGLPAIWYGSRVTTITGLPPEHRSMGINNHGDIVGSGPLLINGISYYTAFVYTRAGVRYIPLGPTWGRYTYASAINDTGQVIGNGHGAVGESARGFLNAGRATQLFDTFGGAWSQAYGINRSGQVVGAGATPNPTGSTPDEHAFLYQNGVMRDVGTLGGNNSNARDINDAGQITGYSSITLRFEEYGYDRDTHAFLYERGTMKDLGTLGGTESMGFAINNAGVVVGESLLPENLARAAFVYARGRMTDLNTEVRLPEGWILVKALDINDKGQILAQACHLEHCNYWARLTPRLEARPDGQEPE
jgi:probable HAF family extracellular repeat protein